MRSELLLVGLQQRATAGSLVGEVTRCKRLSYGRKRLPATGGAGAGQAERRRTVAEGLSGRRFGGRSAAWAAAAVVRRQPLAMATPEMLAKAATMARLPRDVVPRHYALHLTPDLDQCTFHGTVEIDVEVRAARAAGALAEPLGG